MKNVYRPVVDGRVFTMVSMSGQDREAARQYCLGIFRNRFQGFEDER